VNIAVELSTFVQKISLNEWNDVMRTKLICAMPRKYHHIIF